ncbi:DNA mismatch repair protein MutS [Parvularcula sp. IMCC14364]|uniref:DNA mismatch repair protein MutS n=1 Tax=Parvularcula sp. IMCC14364 TaxID=3067902 RepID=UPI002740F7F1|nr:DNA mismatch repair protein MutS [Parvularcula sp. IMCC14364]
MDGSAQPGKVVKPVTPMMAQYLEMKTQAGDALLFFRMGDFYELFFEDAVKAAAALDITLTRRGQHKGEDIPMCGVPWHSHEGYLARLIKAGFKVALCEQTEDPAEAKKRGPKSVVRREIVRFVTPGTLTEETLLETRRNNYLLALSVNRGDNGAIAWADLSTGEIMTRPVTRDDFASELAALSPREVLLSDNLSDAWQGSLSDLHGDHCLTMQASTVYTLQSAQRTLTDFYQVRSLDAYGDFQASEIMAMGALVAYLELTQAGKLPTLKTPQRTARTETMTIDAVTRASLELDQTQRGDSNGSLLSAIDQTVTGPGARHLSSWLARPLTEVEKIRARQQAVQYFHDEPAQREQIRTILKKAPDMQRAISRLGLDRGGPRDLAALRDGIFLAGELGQLLSQSLPETFTNTAVPTHIHQLCEGLAAVPETTGALCAELQEALGDNLPLLTRDGGFIASRYDDTLDELIHLRDNARKVIAGLEDKYRQQSEIKSLKVKHNNVLGYFIETPVAQAERLTEGDSTGEFIHRQTLASAVRFTTVELSELDAKISRARDGAVARELELFRGLCRRVVELAAEISLIAEALADLDVFTGLAELAITQKYFCPVVDDSLAFEVTGGRHPVVEQALRHAPQNENARFIPNDCVLTNDDRAQLWLVTGPNMAGKSTFLRQNALIAILAQIGSFVPASQARIGIVDRVFSRVGASDDLARGRSTFMVEMVETASILNQATARSLVVLDEIGRGTATFDGLSIAWATAEHLHDVNQCRGLFATHYHEMTVLSERLDRLQNVSMKVQEWQQEIVFLHEVVPGSANRSYGVAVARLAGLPASAVKRAEEVLRLLEEGKVHKHGGVDALIQELPLFSAGPPVEGGADWGELAEQVRQVEPDSLTPREALEALYQLKEMLQQHE